jgi:hypothetical protein
MISWKSLWLQWDPSTYPVVKLSDSDLHGVYIDILTGPSSFCKWTEPVRSHELTIFFEGVVIVMQLTQILIQFQTDCVHWAKDFHVLFCLVHSVMLSNH